MDAINVGLLNNINRFVHVDQGRSESIYWDESAVGWKAVRFGAVTQILEDEDSFARDDRFREGALEFWGPRALPMLAGLDQRRNHGLQMSLLRNDFASSISETIIKPTCRELLDALVKVRKAEMASSFADLMPQRVGCRFMGFEADQGRFLDRVGQLSARRDRWKELFASRNGVPLSVPEAQDGLEAITELRALFSPTIHARRREPQDDMISRLWDGGPKINSSWSDEDIVGACWSNFVGGETRYLLRNLIYILLLNPTLRQTLQGNAELIVQFAEEGLRLVGPVSSLVRRVMVDSEIDGVRLKEGQRIFVMLSVANRDPSIWPDPNRFDMGRDNVSRHLAFGYGRRYCVGRHVAREIACTVISALIEMREHMRFDEDGPPVEWSGRHTGSVYPLNVVFVE